MGLGAYPQTALSETRETAAHYRKILKSGADPIGHRALERKREAMEKAKAITCTQCATRYIRAHPHGWANPKHRRQWVSTLKT
jgi:hypothetical protein